MNRFGNIMKDGSKFSGDFLLGLILTAFSIFVIVESAHMPQRGTLGIFMSPGFVPLITGSILLFLSLLFTISAFLKGGYRNLGQWFLNNIAGEENKRFLVILSLMGFYAIGLVGHIPFIGATLIFHFLIFWYLKVGGMVKIVAYSLLVTFLVAFLLPTLFNMPLP